MIRALTLVLCAVLCSCTRAPAQPHAAWTTGFWFWNGSNSAVAATPPLDILYYQGSEDKPKLPPAKEYWIVFRYHSYGLPDDQWVRMVEERLQGFRVAGVQLDVDCPTGRLGEYAKFLQKFRKQLPPNTGLSITALLDWFNDDTSIEEVIDVVDEFVPQFYDIGDREAVAATIDAAKWAPRFNRYGKRFRIGISTFGRALGEHISYQDVTPLQLALKPGAQVTPTVAKTGEVRLRIDSADGTHVNFILPTPESIATSVAEARKMGAYCAGVLFFRWPSFNEVLAVRPDQVLRAAGIPVKAEPNAHLQAVDRDCAAVRCTDLYLISPEPLSSRPLSYRIATSQPLEYFLPFEGAPAKMSASSELSLDIPAYCGQAMLYLGRAVTRAKTEFRLEQLP